MTIDYRCTVKNGKLFLHLPPHERPCSYNIDARDDDGNVFSFKSDGQTVTPRDWQDAEIRGRRYNHSDAWNPDPVGYIHDPNAIAEPKPVFFAYSKNGYGKDGPHLEDLTLLTEAINRVTTRPVQFRRGETITVTI